MDKNQAAVMLGRLGGQARAKSLTPERRAEIARKASRSRKLYTEDKEHLSGKIDSCVINPHNNSWCDTHNKAVYACKQYTEDIKEVKES